MVFVAFLVLSFYKESPGSAAGFGYAEEPVNPRKVAMGSAGTALEGGGFTFYNPALPSIIDRPYISCEYGRLYNDLGRGMPEFALNFPKWFIGGAFQSQSIDFQFADEQGIMEGVTGVEQSTLGSLDIGFTKQQFAFGVAINGFQHRIAEYKSFAFSGSAGLLYSIVPGKLTAGAAVLNAFGRNTGMLDSVKTWSHSNMPLTGRAGAAWSDTMGKMSYSVAADIVYSDNYGEVMVPIGVEVWLLPSIAVRVGKRFNHPTDLFSAGVGFAWENLAFDASFVPCRYVSDYSLKWGMGITYSLKKKEKGKEKTSGGTVSVKSIQKTVITSDTVGQASVQKDSVVTDTVKNENRTVNSVTSRVDTMTSDTVKIQENKTISDSIGAGMEKAMQNKDGVNRKSENNISEIKPADSSSGGTEALKNSSEAQKLNGSLESLPDSSADKTSPDQKKLKSDSTEAK